MASAIPSSTAQRIKYDVFLSFRGTDTRNSFVSHLYAALCRERISTFLDIGLKRQEEITATMHKSIEASRTSIVIFSKNYGASPWCLDELVKILECRKTMGQIVLPVFYEVDPREVRKQSGAFGEAFSRHVIDFTDKVSRWRTALAEAANYSGWVLGDTRPESLVINDIVNYILKRLHQLSSNLDGLIGMDSHVKQLETLLCLGSFDNRTVGIWGMGGIGKTTIARVIFNKMSGSFENRCFLGNIREKIGKTGLLNLQREFLCEISGGENISADTVDVMSSFIIKRLRNKKVLVVLDDVDNLMDLSSLTGGLNLFGPGSRIIVTSRDKQVLQYCGVDSIYEVKGLNNHESLQLFSHYAFEQSLPTEAYWNLSNRVLQYAKGLPLALKICGSHLCTRSIEQWESILHRLESPLNSEVQEVLQISYYGLDDLDKDIFLDIACFFRGQGIDHVKEILYDSGFYADIGIARLIGKSLISISDKRLEMHNLVQEMGWEIVRQESIYEPGSRSRLWNHEEIYHVLTSNKGTGAVRGINLDLSKIHKLCLSSDSFTRMGNLKFLKFYTPFSKYWEDDSKLYALEGLAYLPASLRLLHWDRYPLNSLPSNFEPRQLVELILCHSKLELLWEGAKCLENLKRINLGHSKYLVKIPDCSLAPKLEHIILEGCSSLSEVHSSIQQLNKLTVLNLKDCVKLKSLSITMDMTSLEMLNLSGCSRLKILRAISPNIKSLLLNGTAIRELPQSIQYISKLDCLNLSNCKRLNALPFGICKLKSLKTLSLSGCSKLENFPEILEPMKKLEILRLDGTAIREVPKTRELDNLKILSFSDCNLYKIPSSFSRLSSLEHLDLRGNNFSNIPGDIRQLFHLKLLDISSCSNLRSLPELPSHIEYVNAHDCTSLESVSIPSSFTVSEWNRPMFLFTNCFKLNLSAFLNSQFIDLQESGLLPSAGICFPGSKIPEQISHQSAGSLLTVQLPVHWSNSQFRGFALAAVIGFKDCLDNHGFLVKCTIKLRAMHGDSISLQQEFIIFHGHSGHWNNSRILGSDHVFLSYNHRVNLMESQGDDWQNKSCHTTASFDFYAVDSMGRPLCGSEVRECGFSLQLAEEENVCGPSCYYY
ncbi:disease resistance-like protein DSC1 [Ricinus communis]|uniref:disease resistance-like protein DSC1 n=1 Tax=Ricinus communis TaxID=3988 RepID=UPI00077241D5|nr:disease resistance-like protein DSC1 [Ricinus communis]|eukprot:XP_015579975.1 disease resistance-like protein DSC1 [Ricinus communis]